MQYILLKFQNQNWTFHESIFSSVSLQQVIWSLIIIQVTKRIAKHDVQAQFECQG